MMNSVYSKFEEHLDDEILAFLLLNLLEPPMIEKRWELIQQRFFSYPPLVKLGLAAMGLGLPMDGAKVLADSFLKHSDLEDAFPGHGSFHEFHYKFFWVAKAIAAIQRNERKQIQYYHALISVTSLPPGQIKMMYAVTLSLWLREELQKIASAAS